MQVPPHCVPPPPKNLNNFFFSFWSAGDWTQGLALLVKHSTAKLYPFRELVFYSFSWEVLSWSLNHFLRSSAFRQEHVLGCPAHSRTWLRASHPYLYPLHLYPCPLSSQWRLVMAVDVFSKMTVKETGVDSEGILSVRNFTQARKGR